jgi:hypothetical protein
LILALPVEVAAINQQSTLFSMQRNAGKEFRLAFDDTPKRIDAEGDKGSSRITM